ncbi:MAG: hypothetical protein KatS3mg034_1420 [Vicingaceae bacterium]|jgi:sec-independent protein translocase protein TatA|nr:MAG: hypothetical protein KatS3mg034_1420 [Vicingaceae bacterium]
MLLFLDIGFSELLLIVLVVLIFFGANKVPEMMKSFGRGIYEMKKASQQVKDEITKAKDELEETTKLND